MIEGRKKCDEVSSKEPPRRLGRFSMGRECVKDVLALELANSRMTIR